MKRFAIDSTPENTKKVKFIPLNVTEFRGLVMNPGTLGLIAHKKWDHKIAGFIVHLKKALEVEEEWVKHLNITCIATRKIQGTNDKELKTDKGYPWYMILRSIKGKDYDNAESILKKWGNEIVKLFNNKIVEEFFLNKNKIFEYNGLLEPNKEIGNLGDYIIQKSVVFYCRKAYSDTIKTGNFFGDQDLMNCLFPDVLNPECLF